jgi:hypothetical protein
MPELISLSEAARRLDCSKQAMSKWLAEGSDFPATVVRGRSRLIDWLEVRRWVLARRRDQAVADRVRQREAEFKRLRAMIWHRARQFMDPYFLSICLADCATPGDLHRKARELGVGPLK